MTFIKVSSDEVKDVFPYTVNKYQSSRSKMQLVHINNYTSPMVKGHFVFATELHDNSGLPSVLEQMVFGGSEKYPYDKFLSKVSNAGLCSVASRTRKDYSAYQLFSYGWNAFKKFVPLYVDHLFHPTLTPESFTTYVHFLHPETFEDMGLVYLDAEQNVCNSSWITDEPANNNTMFDDESGYRFEEGGLPSDIRELKIEDVKKYHEETYTSDNLCLIIQGDISESELLQAMNEIDESLPVASSTKGKPFLDTASAKTLVPQFGGNQSKKGKTIHNPHEYAEELELKMSWVTALASEPLLNVSLYVIFQYLANGVQSVMFEQLVDTPKAFVNLCLNETDYYYRTIMSICFYGISKSNLEKAKETIWTLLSTHKIDLEKIKATLALSNEKFNDSEEETSLKTLNSCISNFLYNDDPKNEKSLSRYLYKSEFFTVLESYTEEEWQKIFDKWIVENAPTVLISEPSQSLFEEQIEENEKRVAERAELFGDEEESGKLLKILERADEKNKSKMSMEEVESKIFLENPADTIKFTETVSISPLGNAETALAKKVLAHKPADLPMFIHIENIPSKLVELHVMMDPRCIQNAQMLPFYHIFCESLSMPMKTADGDIISEEEVEYLKHEDILHGEISYGESTHLNNEILDTININIIADSYKYESCIEWIKHIFYDMVFDEDKVTMILEQFLEDCYYSLQPYFILKASINQKCLSEHSLTNALGDTFCAKIFEQILKDIHEGNFKESVLPKIEQFRKLLLENIGISHVLVLGDVESIGVENLYKPWTEAFEPSATVSKNIPEIPTIRSGLTDFGKDKGQHRAFVYLRKDKVKEEEEEEEEEVDSFFGDDDDNETIGTSSIVVSTSLNIDYNHADYPAILVALDTLKFPQSGYWKMTAEEKKCFLSTMVVDVEMNEIKCELINSSDAIEAYDKLRKILDEYASNGGSDEINKHLYAVSCSRIRKTTHDYNSHSKCAKKAYENVFNKKVGKNYDEILLSKIAHVNKSQVVEAFKKYFFPLFDSDRSTVFVNCDITEKDKFVAFLESKKYKTVVENMPESSHD